MISFYKRNIIALYILKDYNTSDKKVLQNKEELKWQK